MKTSVDKEPKMQTNNTPKGKKTSENNDPGETDTKSNGDPPEVQKEDRRDTEDEPSDENKKESGTQSHKGVELMLKECEKFNEESLQNLSGQGKEESVFPADEGIDITPSACEQSHKDIDQDKDEGVDITLDSCKPSHKDIEQNKSNRQKMDSVIQPYGDLDAIQKSNKKSSCPHQHASLISTDEGIEIIPNSCEQSCEESEHETSDLCNKESVIQPGEDVESILQACKVFNQTIEVKPSNLHKQNSVLPSKQGMEIILNECYQEQKPPVSKHSEEEDKHKICAELNQNNIDNLSENSKQHIMLQQCRDSSTKKEEGCHRGAEKEPMLKICEHSDDEEMNFRNEDSLRRRNSVRKLERRASVWVERNVFNRLQTKFLRNISSLFDSLGRLIARSPIITLVVCIAIPMVCYFGFFNYTGVTYDNISLWVPEKSDAKANSEWLNKNHPQKVSYHVAIVKSNESILTKDGLLTVLHLQQKLPSVQTANGTVTWEDICKKDTFPNEYSELGTIQKAVYIWNDFWLGEKCAQFTKLCLPVSILHPFLNILPPNEFASWDGGFNYLGSLTEEEILKRVNDAFNDNKTKEMLKNTLGGIEIDEHGNITGAKATQILIKTKNLQNSTDDHDFEKALIKTLLNDTSNDNYDIPKGIEITAMVQSSFNDVIKDSIYDNISLVYISTAIVIIYIYLVLSRLNFVEHRFWLTIAGLLGVVLCMMYTVGMCTAFNLIFGQLHGVFPFLMFGIGMDDVFVLVQSYENLSPEEKKEDLETRFGKTVSYAGMAVTVTSITNALAFAISAATINIPALISFNIYCSVGVFFTYIYSLTFFTACMVLDQKRIDERKDGCVLCYTHQVSDVSNKCQKIDVLGKIFQLYSKLLTHRLTKAVICLISLGLLGLGCFGVTRIRYQFEERWLVPENTPLADFFNDRKEFFGDQGERGTIYFSVNITDEQLDKIANLVDDLRNATLDNGKKLIKDNIDSWAVGFAEFMKKRTDEDLMSKLTEYLFQKNSTGFMFQDSFVFNETLNCENDQVNAAISMFKIGYQHPLFDGPMEHVPALQKMRKLIKDAKFSEESHVFEQSPKYAIWGMDVILQSNFFYSLIVTVVLVFIIIIFMLANFTCAVFVLICVVFTLVDVIGFMHFMDMSLNTVTSIILLLCVGLSVDYAAHIGHAFLETWEDIIEALNDDSPGSTERINNLKMEKTLLNIGPAVLYGGLSTLLATVPLAFSAYYSFRVFFQLFLLVVLFGLYHGLVFLPVVLSVVGPTHHQQRKRITLRMDQFSIDHNNSL